TRADGDGIGRVEVWISDRVTGKTTTQTILPRSTREAPTVLSVRALELLRASLRDVAPDEAQVKVEGAHPGRAQSAVREMRAPPPPDSTILFDAGVVGTWSLPDGADAYGPEISIGYVSGAFGARLFGLGPMQGGRENASVGSIRYQMFGLGIEPLLL